MPCGYNEGDNLSPEGQGPLGLQGQMHPVPVKVVPAAMDEAVQAPMGVHTQ